MRRLSGEMQGPLSLVYIAGHVAEAEKVERVLTEQGIDYTISLEPFMKSSATGTVFGGTYAGVFFFVPSDRQDACRDVLHAQGLRETMVPETIMEQADGA